MPEIRIQIRRAAAAQTGIIETLSFALSRVAAHDLTCRIAAAVPPAYEPLKTNFNSAVETLQQAISAVMKGVNTFNSATREIADAADDLSRRTEQQAASLEETAAAVQEINTSVKSNAEGANHARDIVASANSEVEKSSHTAQSTLEAMRRIEKSSSDIAQIIGVIDEIAFQTNLLALNAGVEAARAGEAGKGFAVVASEVRALAQRAAEAAKEIKHLISTAGSEVQDGVKFVAETRAGLQGIVGMMAEINQVVAKTAAATSEQLSSVQQINLVLQEMDKDTQKNAAMVEETTAATHSLRQESSDLVKAISEFNIGAEFKNAQEERGQRAPRRQSASTPVPRREARTVGTSALKLAEGEPEGDWAEF